MWRVLPSNVLPCLNLVFMFTLVFTPLSSFLWSWRFYFQTTCHSCSWQQMKPHRGIQRKFPESPGRPIDRLAGLPHPHQGEGGAQWLPHHVAPRWLALLSGEHQPTALPKLSAATTFSWGCTRCPLPHRELGWRGQGTTLNLPHFLLNRRVPQRTLGGDVSTNAGRDLVQKGGARAGAQGRTESSLRRPRGPCSTKDLWGSRNGRGSGPPESGLPAPGGPAARCWHFRLTTVCSKDV